MRHFKLSSVITIEQKPTVRSKFLEVVDSYPCLLKIEYILGQTTVKIFLVKDSTKEIFMSNTSFRKALAKITYEVID